MMSNEELNRIKKALYKEKPVARRQLDYAKNIWAYAVKLADETWVHFAVPADDMGGGAGFNNEMPAQLLIRWIVIDDDKETVTIA